MSLIIADNIKETSTSTGTGAMTLAGAVTGARAFSAKCVVGDTCFFAIRAVDAAGAPTGDWETGLGTYSAASTLTRTTLLDSSTGAVVSFAAGTKHVYLTQPAAQVAWARERLAANRIYYVRSDGNNTNTGLANTAGGAFLTLQKAVDVVCGLDMASYTVTIQIADGTYTTATVLKPYVGTEAPIINGNATTPANVLLSTSGAVIDSQRCGKWVLQYFKLQNSTSGNGITANAGCEILFSGLDFGAIRANHLAALSGGIISAAGNYTVSGGSTYSAHALASMGGLVITTGRTVTITGTPAFVQGWAWGSGGGGVLSMAAQTFSGSATGPRYTLSMGAMCVVNGAATTYLPGSTAGTTATGAVYG